MSVGRFLTMIAAEVFAVATDMPDVGSHTLLVLVSGSCLLAYVGWTARRSRRLPDPGTLFERYAPFFGVQLLVVYAVAAIAKINTGFFDIQSSCAASISRQVAWFHPPLLDGAWRVAPSIWGTVALEVALPVLLAIRRTRLIGLVLGGDGTRLVRFELERYLRSHPGTTASYAMTTATGETIRVTGSNAYLRWAVDPDPRQDRQVPTCAPTESGRVLRRQLTSTGRPYNADVAAYNDACTPTPTS